VPVGLDSQFARSAFYLFFAPASIIRECISAAASLSALYLLCAGAALEKRYKHAVLSDEKHFKMVPLLGGCARELVAVGTSAK
jgi:hypothetical protein